MIVRLVLSGAVAASLGPLGAAGARAGDEDGLGGLFGRIFGAPRGPAAVEAVPDAIQRAPRFSEGTRFTEGRRMRLRIRYAALPKTDPLRGEVSERQKPLDLSQGPAAAFMKDETLRSGDIVVMGDGARVFTGSRGKRHASADFEPAFRSRTLDARTRRQLAGMVLTPGATAPEAARRVVVRLKGPASAPEPAQAAVSPAPAPAGTMRVINPWVMVR